MTSFVYNQLFSTPTNYQFLVYYNKRNSDKTSRQCTIKQKNEGGEISHLLELMYVTLFQYCKEFNIKGFIPVFICSANLDPIADLTFQAISYSRLFYYMYGKYM